MLDTIRNAWNVKELRTKILYTLLMLLIYRLCSVIPTPGVNVAFIASQVENIGLLGMLDFINGQNFSNFTIAAMGIQPYITASIIIQLLTVAIPSLEKLSKEGEEGRRKLAQYSRYMTVAIGFIQAVGIILGMGTGAVTSTSFWNYIRIGLCLAAGTAFTMWIGERITDKGIGNGISLLIFIGIIASFPGQIYNGLVQIAATPTLIWTVPLVLIGILAIVVAIVWVDNGTRRIVVQYAKRQVGRRMYGGQSSHIPLKVNASGVMPIIFAISILQLPGLIGAFWPTSGFSLWWNKWFAASSWLYVIIFALLIFGFTFFYSSIVFNPIEISKNLQTQGGFIPGIRPGRPTSEYLARINSRITLFGAIFLMLIATIPNLLLILANVQAPFTATGIMIVVSVALETNRAIESQMMMRHYKGFMK